jgi:hypothetical protein
MCRLASTVIIAAIAFAFTLSTVHAATADRTWVSHNGSASNASLNPPCTQQAPCDSFATAINVTNSGGEIDCLDNGGYSSVSITQSVTIDCGQLGAVGVSGSNNGININGSDIIVILRHLTINGNFGAGNGVSISQANAVTIENCVIQGFQGGTGISVSSSEGMQLNVADTLIVNNGSAGIVINPPGGGALFGFVFDHIRVENNSASGISVNGTSGTGVITGVIRDSVITGNPTGIIAETGVNASSVAVSLDHTHVANNGTGVSSQGGAAVILNNSTIQTNGTGLNASGGGAIFSYGNNAINGNQPGGIGTAPIAIGFH